MDTDRETLQTFAGFTVDRSRRRLEKNGQNLPLTAKAFETLCVLIDRRGDTVTKSELMDAVWGDVAVEENNLTQQISAIRRALGEKRDEHRFIVTAPGRGYAFIAELDVPTLTQAEKPGFFRSGARRGYSFAAAYILLIALSFLFQGAKPSRPQSLAVVDFRAAETDRFISTGISDTLRARLGSVEDIVVKPGALRLDGDVVTLGRDLQVDAVVVGSVQRDHGRVRVAVQMVDVGAGRIIWGKTFDENDGGVFALQDSIAGELARALNVEISRMSASDAPRSIPA